MDPNDTTGSLIEVPYALGEEQAFKAASLAKRASIVARRLYASLPRGLRIVNLFVKLADGTASLNTFARIVYGEFVRKHIKGLPPIGGKPVEEAIQDVNDPDLVRKLPSNYGTDFGRKAYGMLLQMGITPDAVPDLLQDFLIDFLGDSPIQDGRSLHEAEHYTLRGLRMFAMTRRRSMKRLRQRESPTLVTDDGDDGAAVREIKDDAIFDRVNSMVSADYMNRMIKHLDQKLKGKIGEDVIPRYFELSLEEGVDDKRMIQDDMLPLTKYKGVSGWNNFKTKFLYPAALEYFMENPPSDDFKKRLDRHLAR